jgi:hypothetical protein
MSGTIYADSFGGLTAARQADDRIRQQAIQQAVATAASSLSQARTANLQNRQLNFQQKEAEDKTALEKQQMTQRQKQADREYLLNVGQNTISKGRLDLERQRFNFEKTVPKPAQAREYQLLLDTAEQEANEGGIADEKDFVDKYPTLPAGLARVFVQKSQNARPVIEAQYKVASSLAGALTERDKTKQQLDDATALAAKHHTFWSNPDEVNNAITALPILTRKYQALNQTLPEKKEWQNLVYFDPDKGYQPAITPPRWMQLPQQPNPPQKPQAGGGENAPDDFSGAQPVNRVTAKAVSPTASAAAPPVQPASEPMFKMRTRDGNLWNIPQSRVKDAMARGAAVVGTPPVRSADPLSPLGMVEHGYLH